MVNNTQVQPLQPLTWDGSPPPAPALHPLQAPRKGSSWVYKARSPDLVQRGFLVSMVVRLTPSWTNLGTPRNTCWLVCISQEYSPSFGGKGISSPGFFSRPPQKVKCVDKKVSFLIKGHHFLPQPLLLRSILTLNPSGTLLKVAGKTAEKRPQGCNWEPWGGSVFCRDGV